MVKKFSSIKGMEDLFDPEETKKWHWVEATARQLFEKAGFQEIRTPILEEAALFERSVGDSTEIVEKEMYTLEDRQGTKLALRPENTASVARAFIEHFTTHDILDGRFYYMGPMYRYERPQKGRYRQFHQIGAEVFGVDHPLIDAELIGLAHHLFFDLKLPAFQLQLNSLGSAECRKKYRDTLLHFLKQHREELCDECQKRIERNPLRALDCKKPPCMAVTEKAPLIFDSLSEESRKHFKIVQEALQTLEVPFELNHRLVRGLDYYEKTVFEFISPELGAQNAVAAGGRYNDLVKDLGGPAVPGVGFALGMERLITLLPAATVMSMKRPKVYMIGLDEISNRELFAQLPSLREVGAIVELDPGSGSLKSKMRRATKWKAEWVVILGEEERNKGVTVLRDMTDSSQEEVPRDELFSKILSRFPTLHYYPR